MDLNKYAVIVAGGNGTRMLSTVPKQFIILAGLPVLMHTIKAFNDADSSINIILVLPDAQIYFWKQLCVKYNFEIDHQIVEGGETRFHSVKNALVRVDKESLIAIHDGVRPLVSASIINRIFETAAMKGNAVPVVPLRESIRFLKDGKSEAVNRVNYRLVQTPQCFTSSILQEAYKQELQETFTDDASVAEANGTIINLIEGDFRNIKITTPDDLVIAESFFKGDI